MKNAYKVPFRQVYCDTLIEWLKATIWCHFVIRVWPNVQDFGSAALLQECLDDPQFFHDQYEWLLERALRDQKKHSKAPRDIFVGPSEEGYPVFCTPQGRLVTRYPRKFDLAWLRPRTGKVAVREKLAWEPHEAPVTERDQQTELVQYILGTTS